MRNVVVATHGHCFDGMCSAVMFTRLLRHLHPDEQLAFTYRSMGYGPGSNGVDPAILTGDENAILDYRFSAAPQLTWYFDHHVSAFPADAERAAYEQRSHATARKMFHDGTYGSCTKLIADVGHAQFGLDVSGDATLVRWADMIDSAAFPFAYYRALITNRLRAAWSRPTVPGGLSAPIRATVRFEILRGGALADIALGSASGHPPLDRSALRAAYDANPLPPLPDEFEGDRLAVNFYFELLPEP